MLTNPSTLGLFERRIVELLDAVHAAGALAYMDGANMNAILGKFKPGAAGFDVMHFNIAQDVLDAARRRRAGRRTGRRQRDAGAVPAVAARRARGGRARSGWSGAGERPTSIGRVRAYQGSVGVLRARLCLHPGARRQRPAPGERGRRAGRELPASKRVGDAYELPFDQVRASTSSWPPARRSRRRPACARSTSPSASSTTASTRRRSTSR